MLLDRSDLWLMRLTMTLEELIVWLINDYDDDMHPEDRFELELALLVELEN